jgi:hypothetical protein
VTFDDPQIYFTPYTSILAEGGKIGVMSCLVCGAAVMIDPSDKGTDPGIIHYRWHRSRGELTKGQAGEESGNGGEKNGDP